MDRFDSMNVFVKVVETGSFAGAARRLNVSPGVVTTRVKDLEDHLGIRLLNRTTRNVSLTEVGRTYYEGCLRLLGELDDLERAATELQRRPRGVLRVNAPPSFGVLHLAPMIASFTELYPEVSVELNLTDQMADLVDEGFDIGIRMGPLPESSLIARRLSPVRYAVCGAPIYLARHGTPRTPEELVDHNCLTLSQFAHAEWLFTGPQGEPHSVRVSGNLRANNAGALRAAAIAGQGLIQQPTYLVGEDIKAGLLVPLLTEYTGVEAPILVLYPHRHHLSAKVRAFVDFLVERFGHDPGWDKWRPEMAPHAADAPDAAEQEGVTRARRAPF